MDIALKPQEVKLLILYLADVSAEDLVCVREKLAISMRKYRRRLDLQNGSQTTGSPGRNGKSYR